MLFHAVVLPMYRKLWTGPASSVLVGVMVLMVPIPSAFLRWERRLKKGGSSKLSGCAVDYNRAFVD
jgi:hypothetical protein